MLSKVYKFKFLLALMLVPFLVSADPPGWDKTETLFTHVITVPSGVTPTIDGVPIETGDWIGVFFNDAGTLVCGGSIEYTTGVSNSFSAYGDDPLTVGVKDGFAAGESFIWKIYDSSEGMDHWAEATYSAGTNDFVVFGFSTVSTLVAPAFAVTASADPDVLCAPGDVTLTGELLAGGPVDEWNWYTGGVGGTLVGTGETIVVAVSETTTFTLEAVDDLLTTTATVTVVGAPTVSAGADAAICASEAPVGFELVDAMATNYIALSWVTTGDGTFDNANALNPIYFPGPGDEANGTVTLTLTAISTECGPVDASMMLTIQPEPMINILPEQDFVCFGESYDFDGMVEASNYDDLQWFTTNGAGTFSPNETVLEPLYNPSPAVDYPQICIEIGVAASAIDPCVVSAEDFMDLCFVAPPEVFAGDDMAFCTEGLLDYNFADAIIEFDPNWGGEIIWTSTGDGTFDDPTLMNPTYTFGVNDLAMTGSITFVVTAETPEACGPVSDEVVISVQLPPSIDIIPDSYTICEGEVMDFEDLVDAANYDALQWFTTNGGGNYDDESLLEPIYFPSPTVDYPQGCIELGVAASAIDPCVVSAEDFMDLCFQMLPVVVAGEDATICANETYTTNPTVENTVGPYEWTHDGNGYIEDPDQLIATYVADAADGNTVVTLTLTAQPISPCTIEQSGSMELTVLPAPYVNAGEDFTVCETENPELCGEAEYVSETMWATTGDGWFCCPDDLCPVTYYPGPQDLADGCVTLILIGYPLEPCSLYELDKVVVCFDPAPMVDAGVDMTICEDGTAQLDGMTEDVCGIQWVTFDGTGTFDDETIEDPIYTPSFQDVISGTVHLIMIGAPCGTCTEPAMDTLALTIQRLPVAMAGDDATICEDGSYMLMGAVENACGNYWYTNGDGTFDDVNMLGATYTPGAQDILDGMVELCLVAEPCDPCTIEDTDCMMLNVQYLPTVDIIPDASTICFDQEFCFDGLVVAENYAALQWFTTNGGGSFSNETVLEPCYFPSPTVDYPQGCITIGVAAAPIDPCSVGAEDFMELCFQPPIELEITQSAIICEDATFTPDAYLLENACGVMWTTDGDGTFDDPALEYPVYTPGAGDIANGAFTLTLEAIGCATCANVTAEVFVEIQYLPIAYAGEDDVVCEQLCFPPWTNGQYTLDMATVEYACGQYWTTAGDGTFDDETALNPVYTLGDNDIVNGSVELCLVAEPCDPCTVSDTDCMTLTVQYFPEANAGPDVTICEGNTAQLDGSTMYASGVFWDFALLGEGDGTWSDQLIEDPVYTPGPEDIDRGYVELVMVAFPINPCTYPDADVMTVFITPQPFVEIEGGDATICEGETIEICAFIEDADTWTWSTSGDGTFDPDPPVDVACITYTPGPMDIAAGFVDICIEAFDGPECTGQYADCMTLTILPPPIVFAGDDAVICCYESYTIADATADNVSSVMWTTAGTGTFDDATLVNPTYTPSAEDCVAGSVTLTMEGFPVDPCTLSATDEMVLIINPEPVASFCINGDVIGTGDLYEFCYNEDVMVSLCDAVGTGPFEVCWEVNGVPECATIEVGDPLFEGILPVGTYEVMITSFTDFNGCAVQDVTPYYFTVVVNPEPIASFCVNGDVAETGEIYEFCYDTEVDVTLCDLVEGEGPFEVCYTVNAEPEVCVTVNEGESLFTDVLAPGTYDVAVTSITDANGCMVADVTPYMLTVIINPEPAVGFCVNGDLADTGEQYEFCYDTEVDVTLCEVWSGTGPFEVCYTVNAEPEVCVTVNEGESLFTDLLEPGTYDVQVTSITDINGCVASDVTPYNMSVTILPEPFLVFAFNGVQVAPGFEETYCEDTPVVVTLDEIWAGCAPFEVCYSINGEPEVCVTVENPGDELFNQTMAPGVYTVVVTSLTDACGCIASQATLDLYTATITIQALPTIEPMADVTSCVTEFDPYCIDATAANYSSLLWTTNGSGTFDDPTIEDPCYTASADDIGTGSVELCLTAQPMDPCALVVTECFTLTLLEGPTAYAGDDMTICEDECYTLADAVATNYDALQWYTIGGDGVFNDETIMNPEYCPGMMDIINGSVELCLIAAPIDPCTVAAEDCMVLTIQLAPVVTPMDDVTICEDEVPYCIDATAANYSALLWTTTGTGTFDDPTVEDVCYTPSMDDLGTGFVELCLTAEATDPCFVADTECFVLNFQLAPVVEPLDDATICEGDIICLDATVYNGAALLWTTSGTGTFDNPTMEDACYTPSADDIIAGTVELCITADPSGPCPDASTECMTLTIQGAAVADAGLDATVCETETFDTDGTAMNYLLVEWTTTGDGFFADDAALITEYFPGPNDLAIGEVELCLTAEPVGPCQLEDTDCMTLFFDPTPTAFAGVDATICEGDTYVLADAFAADASSVVWTTAGDGSFDDPTATNPIYTPGPLDIANGGVDLCMEAMPTGGCTLTDIDCMFLSIVPNPTIDLMGEVFLDCDNFDFIDGVWLPVEACADVEFAESVQWFTDGDGSFDDPTDPCTNYNLGPNDVWAQEVTLTIEAYGPDACQVVTSATMVIHVPTQIIEITTPTWWGISSYVDKSDTSVPEVMEPTVGPGPGSEDLIIMINENGKYYWPEPSPPINQLGNWAPIGYKDKFKNPTCLPIYGDILADDTFEVNGAFTYVPVLTNVETPIATLFAGHLTDILLIYDWPTGQLWTNTAADFTTLLPGRAYLLVSTNPAITYTVDFPDFDPNAGPAVTAATPAPQAELDNNSPWNDVVNTSQPHFMLFADEALAQIKVGDIIGAFNQYDECVGMAEFTSRDSFYKLIAMGDDPITEELDGFENGENMTFKLYRQETDETFEVVFTYDPEYPSYDNMFTVNGASKVTGITMNATSIGDIAVDKSINVYPNPATDVINIASDYSMKRVTLVNYVGQTVYTQEVIGNDYQINVSSYTTGMYFVRIETTNGSVVTKRITIE